MCYRTSRRYITDKVLQMLTGPVCYTLSTSGQGSESVKMYESCSKPLSFEETCGLALALYKADEYQDSMKGTKLRFYVPPI